MSAANKSHDELQQELLELVYGLLSDDEAAVVEGRIKTDPEFAVLYGDAQRFADILAASARLAAPQVELSPPKSAAWRRHVVIRTERNGAAAAARDPSPSLLMGVGRGEGEGVADGTALPFTPGPSPARGEGRIETTSSGRSSSAVELRIGRAMRRTAAIAAAVLAIVTLGGYLVSNSRLTGLEAKHLRLVVTGPRKLEPGIDNLFTINASSPAGRPIAAEISYVLRTADGNLLVPKTEQATDGDGRLTVKLRPELTGGMLSGDRASHEAVLEIAAAGQTGATPLTAPVTVASNGLATQLALDKPLYQPGEIVRYRSLTLTRFGLNPPSEAAVEFEIHDPSGAVVPGSAIGSQTERGVGVGAFPIPGSLAGGEYALIARSPTHQFADEKRSFFVRHYRLPRLKKDLEFTRDSYAPGDHVVADLFVQRTEGSPAGGAKLHSIVTVDGQVVSQTDDQARPTGTARVEFTLPSKIERGDGQLAVVIDDGGNKETVAKTIRINLDRVEVSLYPEGGDLAVGMENRVYFTSHNPLGKPAHIDGQLIDRGGHAVARVETTYKGMGSFKLTPLADEVYTLKLTGPMHVTQEPKTLAPNPARHVVLSTGRGVFEPKQPLAFDLQSSVNNVPLVVAAYCRGVPVGQQAVTAHQGMNHVEIPLASQVGGAVRVTVYERAEDLQRDMPRAIAERLVYRRPERTLNVRVADHKPRFTPGDPVELSLAVTNERGEPTPAVLGVSVGPDALLKMIDDELPSMPTHFYLTTEVEKPEDLEKADFYLSDDPQAPAALDLLLGTQGWRRFAEQRLDDFVFAKPGTESLARLAALGEIGGPLLVLDNGPQAAQSYQADLDRHQIERAGELRSLGQYVLLGGVPVALLLLFFVAWGSVGGLRFWLPTMGTAAACLLVAWKWSGNVPNSSNVADASSATAASLAAARHRNAPAALFGNVASDDIYFEPSDFRLPANSWQFQPSIPNLLQHDRNRYGAYQPTIQYYLVDQSTAPSTAVNGDGTRVDSSNRFSMGGTGMGALTFSGAGYAIGGGTLAYGNTGVNGTIAFGTGKINLNGVNSTSGEFSGGYGRAADVWVVSNGSLKFSGTLAAVNDNVYSTGKTIDGKVGAAMTDGSTRATAADQRYVRISAVPLFSSVGDVDAYNFATGSTQAVEEQGGGITGRGRPEDVKVRIADGQIRDEMGKQYFANMHSVDESSIPLPEETPTVYPSAERWRLLTTDRNKYKSVHLKEPGVAEAQVIEALNEPTEMDFIDTPLKDVIDALKLRHGIEIQLDQRAISEVSGGTDMAITQSLKGIPLKSALRSMLQEHRLNFVGDHDVLLITSDTKAKEHVVTKVTVRQYAHHHESFASGARTDFTDTLYWNPLLITGADGKATIKFDLSDAVAKYRVLVDAHAHLAPAGEGRIGSGSGEVVSQLPISLEPKLPLEVNAGDRIDLPVAIVNDTDGELPVALALDVPSAGESHEIISPTVPKLLEVDGSAAQQVKLPAGGRARAYFPLNVIGVSGTAQIEVRGQAGKLTDAKRQTLAVVPAGYPVAASYGGNLKGDVNLTVRIPKDIVPGSLRVRLAAYPSAIGQIEDGFESILREPTGCFEQASTENYPYVLALEYLQEHKLANPELTRRCKMLLQSGYARLTSYEANSGGFEWFGGDPGHETLTAYGLMEFHEMARVYPVDPALLERTTEWLLSRRDGHGGFKRGSTGHQFGFGSPELNDAYITWALTEVGVAGIEAEIKHAIAVGKKSEDPYIIALAAIAALNAHDETAGRQLLDWLVKLEAADGHLDGRESFAYSGGLSLQVETTALAALAWLKMPAYWPQAQKAIDWIGEHREGTGGFGSTQATILALKAFVEHARLNHKTVNGGELIIKRDGQPIGRQPFASGQDETIRIDGLAAKLEPGENHLTLSLSGENRMPYALEVSYRSFTGASDPACAVRLSTKLATGEVKAGETVALEAELSNATDKPQPMTIAILGLPAGLQPRAKQLDDLKKSGAVDYFETRPREIICYWRSLAARQKIPLRLDLVAEVPGEYTAPASRAYLYYTAEQKQWAEPLKVKITRE